MKIDKSSPTRGSFTIVLIVEGGVGHEEHVLRIPSFLEVKEN